MERSAWCDTTTSRRATGRTAASGQFAGIRRRERERAKARRRSLRRSLHLLDFLGMPTIQIKKTGEEPGAASLAVTVPVEQVQEAEARDRKSTRLNSSHRTISYAVFCLKKKKQ